MKKFLILTSLLAINVQGMPEERNGCEHIKRWSAPGGLWYLEKESYIHHRMFSTPADIKSSINQKSESQKKSVPNSRSKKRKSSNFKKKISETPSKTIKSKPRTHEPNGNFPKILKPKSKTHDQVNSKEQNIIAAKNQQQETDKKIREIRKKKSFEKRFFNFLGNNVGKFVADIVFDFFNH